MAKYDPNLSLDRDKIRFLIGDTDNDHQMLNDKEIEFLLTENGDDIYMTAAVACETIASKFARDVNFRFSTMWQDGSDAFEHYTQLAEKFRDLQALKTSQPEFTFGAALDTDDDAPEIFWYGMHDNPPTSKIES